MQEVELNEQYQRIKRECCIIEDSNIFVNSMELRIHYNGAKKEKNMTTIELNNKTIFVTGAVGFIGSNFVLELLKRSPRLL